MAASPRWDHTRSNFTVGALVKAAVERGLDHAACLSGTSITIGDLNDATAEIEASEELTVIRNILAHLGDHPGLGMEVGGRAALGNSGLLGFAVLSSPSVRSAIEIGCRYLQLSDAFSNITFEESGEQAMIRLDTADIPPDVHDFLLEREVTAIVAVLPTLFRGSTEALLGQYQLDLKLGSERGSRIGASIPGVNVKYCQPSTVLTFPRWVLDNRPPHAHAHTAALLGAQCRDLLQARTHRRGLAEQVRARLLRDPGRIPSMSEIAAELHVDPRTLRRQLSTEDASFRTLVEEARTALSPGLFEIGLSVEEVAKRLGYAEASSFSRAFTRWHGVPPSHYVPTVKSPKPDPA